MTIKGVTIPFEIITFPEALFYLLVYLPRSHALQKLPASGTDLSIQERRDLFETCCNSVPDMEHFLRTWFKGAAMHEIRRDDLKEWLAWGFWNEYSASKVADQAELEEYALAVERKLGRKLKEGYGPHQPVRPSSDPINIQHRPLTYYVFGVGGLDTLMFINMWRCGLQHYPVSRYFRSFPYRPLTTLCAEYSVAKDLSYFYRPHKSKARMPLLFLHGIGIGLGTYTDFFADLVKLNNKNGSHDQIGILAIEIMPISFRLTSQTLRRQEMVRQIRQILSHHGWDKQQFVLAAHSYGTVIATHMLHDPLISPRIGPVVLADPINLWVHMGDIAYSFTAKVPKSASEIQLHYFACTDMGAAHAVTRRFIWTENVLWKREMKGRQFGIVLGGRDIIMAARRCRDYILEDFSDHEIDSFQGGEVVRTKEMEMLWFDDLNHAEAFVFREERQRVVDMVWRYCCG
ncbi:transcription elongation factor spt5 [Elasticomyces elasticus]|nr:transcription elongation factor spt5 [Elasticomyces elasticus]KAK3637309.1 transcription elongation factor spt5 [Elasticomyces elasticus]KAK4918946.1 transcription elongation factor spt5 [Elasticomyces elasticus]KAK5739838.1 transcription elongation factor spt5 [Elasticomyces elasticus]